MSTNTHQEQESPDKSDEETQAESGPKSHPEPSYRPPIQRLYRSRRDRILGGVAGGMAEYFGIDSALMRLIFIVLVLLPGIGVIAYIIAWIIIPEEGNETAVHAETHTPARTTASSQRTLGLILIAIGGLFLAQSLFDFAQLARLWPVILVIAGLAIILNRKRRA